MLSLYWAQFARSFRTVAKRHFVLISVTSSNLPVIALRNQTNFSLEMTFLKQCKMSKPWEKLSKNSLRNPEGGRNTVLWHQNLQQEIMDLLFYRRKGGCNILPEEPKASFPRHSHPGANHGPIGQSEEHGKLFFILPYFTTVSLFT